MAADRDPRRWFGPADLPAIEQEPTARGPLSSEAAELAQRGAITVEGLIPAARCEAIVEAVRPHFERTGAERLTNAAWALAPVRQLAADPAVLALLGRLYGRRAIPFQTLNFRYGTQQPLHRDTEHFDSLPPRFMCGVWVALEDVREGQGPVSYVPGSHRGGTGDAVAFTARQGDALIWAAALEHGGALVTVPGSTRWSQVTHYFFEDCVYCTPRRSDLAAGRLALRHPLVDLGTGRVVTPRFRGERARFRHGADGRSELLAEPGVALPGRAASAARGLWPQIHGRVRPVVARVLGRPPRR